LACPFFPAGKNLSWRQKNFNQSRGKTLSEEEEMPELLQGIHPMGFVVGIIFLYLVADVLDRRRMKRLAEKEEDDDDQDFTF